MNIYNHCFKLIVIQVVFSNLLIGQTFRKHVQRNRWSNLISRTEGGTTPERIALFQQSNRLTEFIPFTGDSARIEDECFNTFEDDHVLIGRFDLSGRKINQFAINGTTQVRPIFTINSSFLFLGDGKKSYHNEISRIGAVENEGTYKGPIVSVINADSNGRLKLIDTFSVNGRVELISFDSLIRTYYLLFSKIVCFDTTNIKSKYFKEGYSTLMQCNLDGKVERYWMFKGSHEGIKIVNQVCLLWGQTNYTWKDSIIEEHKNLAENYPLKFDFVNLDNSTIINSVRIDAKYRHLYVTGNMNEFLVGITSVGPFYVHTKEIPLNTNNNSDNLILFCFDQYGNNKWRRVTSLGPIEVYKINLTSSGIDLLLYKYPQRQGEFVWAGSDIRSDNFSIGANRLILDKRGYPTLNYPILNAELNEITLSENKSTYFLNRYLKDTIFIMNKRYYSSMTPFLKKEFVFMRVDVDTNSFDSDRRTYYLSIYPNPTNSTFGFSGDIYPNSIASIKIYKVTGEIVMSVKQPIQNKIDISNLEIGTYMVTVEIRNRKFGLKVIRN